MSNSSKDQSIKSKFVNREICACISDIADHLFDWEGEKFASYDELENFYKKKCMRCGSGEIEEMDELPEVQKTDAGWVCPVCGTEYEIADYENEEEAKLAALECCGCDDESNTFYKCWCGEIFTEDSYNELDDEPQEVYEWWIVTPWFGEKLKEHGEVVLERWGGWIWGRCCTGQAIYLDDVIDDICSGMCILEGQDHEWEV